MIVLRLPVPPSVNNLYSNRPGRGRYKTSAYRRWIVEADGWYMTQKPLRLPSIIGPYTASIRIPEDTRGDIDNRGKAILDYLVRVALTSDDKMCRKIEIERAPLDCCEITVRPA